MPYSKSAKYTHHRRRPPESIQGNSWATIPISHTEATKKYPKGTLAVTGRSKTTNNWVIQSILIPKE